MTDSDPISVLVVDDEPSIVTLLTEALAMDRRFQVVMSASSGEDAIDAFKSRVPDVVLLDFRLPGMDGMETARAMKRLRADVRIIMVTARDADEIHRLNSKHDVEVVLTKGRFSLNQLHEIVGSPSSRDGRPEGHELSVSEEIAEGNPAHTSQ